MTAIQALCIVAPQFVVLLSVAAFYDQVMYAACDRLGFWFGGVTAIVGIMGIWASSVWAGFYLASFV